MYTEHKYYKFTLKLYSSVNVLLDIDKDIYWPLVAKWRFLPPRGGKIPNEFVQQYSIIKKISLKIKSQ